MSENIDSRSAAQPEAPRYQQPAVPSQPRYSQPAAAGQQDMRAPAENDGLAIASLVLGILWMWGLGSVLAVIFGHVSFANAKRAYRKPSGLTIAGLVLGYAGIALAVIMGIVVAMASSST